MIKINNLNKKFNVGTINEVYALKDINLEVNDGDFITLIGTNGSGKSTLLNAIAGTFLPDTGNIEIFGCNVTYKSDNRRAKFVARVFQNPFSGTAPDMTIVENLHLAYLRGQKRLPKIGLGSSQHKFYREMVARLEMQLEDRMDNIIGSLSGGQRQAITLLMAVITKPKVLLLDEHTAALDPKSAAQVINLTKKFINNDKLTSLMVTHSMQQALELGDRTIMMHKGAIIENITAKEKRFLTTTDLLDKFADIRKNERLNDDFINELLSDYA